MIPIVTALSKVTGTPEEEVNAVFLRNFNALSNKLGRSDTQVFDQALYATCRDLKISVYDLHGIWPQVDTTVQITPSVPAKVAA